MAFNQQSSVLYIKDSFWYFCNSFSEPLQNQPLLAKKSTTFQIHLECQQEYSKQQDLIILDIQPLPPPIPRSKLPRNKGQHYKFILLQIFYKYLRKPTYKQLYTENDKKQYYEKLLKKLNRLKNLREKDFYINHKHFQRIFNIDEQQTIFNRLVCCRIIEQNYQGIFGESKMVDRDLYVREIVGIFPSLEKILQQ